MKIEYVEPTNVIKDLVSNVEEDNHLDEDNKIIPEPDEVRKISNPQHIGTNYLDRDIYHLADVEYLEKRDVGRKPEIKTKKEVRVFALAGSYLSNEMMKDALILEIQYPEINRADRLRIRQADKSCIVITK